MRNEVVINAELGGTVEVQAGIEAGADLGVTLSGGAQIEVEVNRAGPPGPAGPGVPSGGTVGQILAKASGDDYDTEWVSGGGGAVDSVNGQTGTVVLDADDVGALPDDTVIPSAATSTPADLGTAAVGSSSKYAKEDHVHNKPTYSKSDVGLGNVDNVQQYSATNPPPYPVTSVNGSTGAVTLSIPSTASDVGAEPAVTEVTISTAGAVTQALDAGKIYHFTGALTALTITLNAAGAGIIPHYHFDFNCGSTAPTVTIPNTVTMPDGHSFEASKHYEVDILNNYGAVMAWASS